MVNPNWVLISPGLGNAGLFDSETFKSILEAAENPIGILLTNLVLSDSEAHVNNGAMVPAIEIKP